MKIKVWCLCIMGVIAAFMLPCATFAVGTSDGSDSSDKLDSWDTSSTDSAILAAEVTSSEESGLLIVDVSYPFPNKVEFFGGSEDYMRSAYENTYGGKTLLADQIYQMASAAEGGNSYGMVATSSLILGGEIKVTDQNGDDNASFFPSRLPFDTDVRFMSGSEMPDVSLISFIEIMQASQGGLTFNRAFSENQNHLSALCMAVGNAQRTGKGCPVICVWGAGWIHSLLGYRLEEAEAESRIYVYDPDYEMDGTRYISIKKDENNMYSTWRCYAGQDEVWTSDNTHLTFIPYSSLLSDWNNVGKTPIDKMFLTLNSDNVTIKDMEDNEVAKFRNGVIQTSRTDVCRAFEWVTVPDGETQMSVWLPINNVYTIVNEYISDSDFTAYAINIQQSIAVKTDAGAVVLSVEDKTASSFLQILEFNRHYEVQINSVPGSNSNYESLLIEGSTGRTSSLSSLLHGGYLSLYGGEGIKKLVINGEEKNPVEYGAEDIDTRTSVLSFKDVSNNSYYYQPVFWAVERGITNGTTKSTFAPDKKCSRAQIITFLWRAFGSQHPEVNHKFEDVNQNNYYFVAADWAAERELVLGNFFDGAKPCSRLEAVTYFWKLNGSPRNEGCPFDDIQSNTEASHAVGWAVAQGITHGKDARTFAPEETCTRAQIVTFLYRYFQISGD